MITIFSESLQSRLAECLKSLKKRVLYLREKSEEGLYLKTIEFQGFWEPGETPVEPRSSLLLPSSFIFVQADTFTLSYPLQSLGRLSPTSSPASRRSGSHSSACSALPTFPLPSSLVCVNTPSTSSSRSSLMRTRAPSSTYYPSKHNVFILLPSALSPSAPSNSSPS
jgi:hypothetical protein